MKHSPMIRLENAKARFRIAQEQCPHWDYDWDYDSSGSCGDACCAELDAAERELRSARAAADKSERAV